MSTAFRLSVTNIEEALHYYCDVFNLTAVWRGDECALLASHDMCMIVRVKSAPTEMDLSLNKNIVHAYSLYEDYLRVVAAVKNDEKSAMMMIDNGSLEFLAIDRYGLSWSCKYVGLSKLAA